MIKSVDGINFKTNYSQTGRNAGKFPSFNGGYDKAIIENLHHAKALKCMKNLEWLKGEIGGILITALGTGLVAPIFIGCNPFVKAPKNATKEEKQEVKDTKMYTAMRQPISAVLAILFQASVLKYIDKGLDFVFNNPEISKYTRLNIDHQELNTKTYIQSRVKKEMKANGNKKPSFIKALFSKKAKIDRKTYKNTLDEKVKNIQEEQLQKVADSFQTGKINIGKRQLDFKTTADLVNKQIDEYIKAAKSLEKTAENQEQKDTIAKKITELTEAKIKDTKSANSETINKAIKEIAEKCRFNDKDTASKAIFEGTETFDSNLKKVTKKIYKDISKGYKKLIENNYKSWNQLTKIGVGVLITLPITCTALNWIYPRFMEKFFPKLAGKKETSQTEKSGGDK